MDQICSGLILVRKIFIAQLPIQIVLAQDFNNQMQNQQGNKNISQVLRRYKIGSYLWESSLNGIAYILW